MLRAWKNEVWAGSRPVGPFGMVQLQGAMTPALAAAGFTNFSIISMMVSYSGCSPSAHRSRRHFRIIVFLPKTTSAWPRIATNHTTAARQPTARSAAAGPQYVAYAAPSSTPFP